MKKHLINKRRSAIRRLWIVRHKRDKSNAAAEYATLKQQIHDLSMAIALCDIERGDI